VAVAKAVVKVAFPDPKAVMPAAFHAISGHYNFHQASLSIL
jgi:hypothetical protein